MCAAPGCETASVGAALSSSRVLECRFFRFGSRRSRCLLSRKPTRDRALNLGEAKELLKAFREIASAKDFQKTLGNIHKQGSEAVQRMQPMFVGQSFNRTMAMYDFPLTTEGYQDMARGVSKHSWNIHVKAQAHEVERLLRMPPGAFFGIPGEPGQEQDFPPLPEDEPSKTPAKVPPRQEPLPPKSKSRQGIEVLARHAVDNAEVRVALPHDATFFDCKQAISKFLGRDEILRKGRLVQKKGGVYSTYKDDDPIGDVRQVLVLGADLRTVEDQEDDQPPPIHPYAAQPKAPVQSPNEGSRAGVDSYSVPRRREGLEPPPRAKESAYPSADPPPAPPKPPEPKPTPKKAAPPPKPKPPPPPQQYEIRIRHAVEAGPEITLTIWTNWTFDAVREALAKKLGRDDIRRKARFVFKASAGTSPWIAFKDQETVGWAPDGSRRNELMMLGVELDDTEPVETALPLDSMKRLLQELENACAQDDLQVQLEKLHDRGGIALQLGITQLMGQAVQKATELVLGRGWKLQRVIDAVKVHSSDQSVRSLAEGVERRLRLEPGMLFSRPQAGRSANSANRVPMGRSAMEELDHVDSNDEPAGLPELSVQQVIAMQRELHAGFADPAFQRRLDILENFHAKDPKLIPMRQELFLSVQSKVLPKYGFQGSLKGVFDMLEVFRRPDLQHNGEFVRLGLNTQSGLSARKRVQHVIQVRVELTSSADARRSTAHCKQAQEREEVGFPNREAMARRVRGVSALVVAALVLVAARQCMDLCFVTPGAGSSTRRGVATTVATGLASLIGLESAKAYDLPDLPYAYDALEPSIDKATMEFHHDKHHLTYVTNINKALKDKKQPPLVELQKTAIKDGAAFRNSGGGAYNHNFFWLEMAPTGTGGSPSEKLSSAIDASFGSMDDFKAKFEAAGAPGARFGSGWVWLVVTADKKLAITSTPNQDNPLMEGVEGTPGIPILGCDVWEHAYYLKYQYRRPDYIKAWWNVVNWKQVSAWYEGAMGGSAPTA
ncbi:sodA [Symbiodinium necroappetens]|uniref:Superoxide dismutase [Fe] n=1 Tax=Symbiodinium necroappetens TaxID=1628268 RepID=A0A813A4D7_9DINO|nr:sodA [Symbiodinium necroappetens]